MQTFRLLSENPIVESLDYIVEEKNTKDTPSHYLQGYFLSAERPNKNKRQYQLSEMLDEVKRYNSEFVVRNRALGELGHPVDSTEISLEKACWNIVSLEQKDNNYFWGKAKILSTPTGVILKQLVQDDIRVGASSRALGKLVPRGDINMVEGFRLLACDCVHEPSLDRAMMDSIMENRQFIIDQGGKIVELACDSLQCKVNALPKKDLDKYLIEAFSSFFNDLKG